MVKMTSNNDFDILHAGDLNCPAQSLNIKNGLMAHKSVPIALQKEWST
jgi:hypothetical protein